jgi:ubiquinone/menaquinone biosynthesis C-methylase UbiE
MKASASKRQKIFWENGRERREPSHPVIQAFVEPKIKHINRILMDNGGKKNRSLLDIGCGNGFFTYYFKNYYHTVALDFSEFMLKKNSSPLKVCGSANKLPFRDNSFDITFCSNLLHHIENPQEAVSEMKRVSSKYVVLSEPNRNNPLMFMFGLLKKIERGTLKFSLGYMKKLVEGDGLHLLSASNLGIILPNKTPEIILPIIKKLEGEFPCAFYNIIISEKSE